MEAKTIPTLRWLALAGPGWALLPAVSLAAETFSNPLSGQELTVTRTTTSHGRVTIIRSGEGHADTVLQSGTAQEAFIEQHGHGNSATVIQGGSGNRAVVHQGGTSTQGRTRP